MKNVGEASTRRVWMSHDVEGNLCGDQKRYSHLTDEGSDSE